MVRRNSTVEAERALLIELGRLRRAASLSQLRRRQRENSPVTLQLIQSSNRPRRLDKRQAA